MAQTSPWIAIVDDDPSVLRALARLLGVHQINTRTFASAREFLDVLPEGLPECLILDLQMPEMTGLELQHLLISRRISIPTIVITAHGDSAVRDKCMAAGAISLLPKPLDARDLLDAIMDARNAA